MARKVRRCAQCGITAPRRTWIRYGDGAGAPVLCSFACLQTYELGPMEQLRRLLGNHRRRVRSGTDELMSLRGLYHAIDWIAAAEPGEQPRRAGPAAEWTFLLGVSADDYERIEALATERKKGFADTAADLLHDAVRDAAPLHEELQELRDRIEQAQTDRDRAERDRDKAYAEMAGLRTQLTNQQGG